MGIKYASIILIELYALIYVSQCEESHETFLTNADFELGKKIPFKDMINDKFRENLPLQPEVRNVQIAAHYKWPAARVPYVLNVTYTDRERAVIARAMDEYHEKTCVKFVPKTEHDNDYLLLTPYDGRDTYCYSYIGRQSGRQYVKMHGECVRVAAYIHELGHAIGFGHEHQRPDRDSYITIHWDNIEEKFKHDFSLESSHTYTTMGFPYDYYSTMHYPSYSYAKNYSLPAMTPKFPGYDISHENMGLTQTDIKKIQHYYGC